MILLIYPQNGNINSPKLREKLKQLELKVWLLKIYSVHGALTWFEKCLFSPYWQINHKVAVSYSILQACYQFTLVARLAPKWNQISNWLVKGVHTSGYPPAK